MPGSALARAEGRPCAPPEPGAEDAALDKRGAFADIPPGEHWLAGPGFAFGLGAAGLSEFACAPPNVARAVLQQAALAAASALGVDPELAVVFTTHALGCANIYYVPLANDVRGIGYQRSDPREVFDDTPGQRLEGVAFLNDWPYWQPRLDELGSALHHELGHRWGARVHARIGGVASDALLGRAGDHWSYFLDSGGSPLEGNVWRATESGRASATPRFPTQFSALDRYLMGVLPASEVPPFELLAPAPRAGEDCAGRPVGAASPPQTCGPMLLETTATRVSIDDVIAVEGPRAPPPSDALRVLDVLVLVLHSREEAWSAADCQVTASALRERLAAFEPASGGRVRLRDALAGARAPGADGGRDALDGVLDGVIDAAPDDALACDALARASALSLAAPAAGAPAPPDGAACATSPGAAKPGAARDRTSAAAFGLAALGAWCLRRRGLRPRAPRGG